MIPRVALVGTPILKGECTVWRNNNFQQIVGLSLSYDGGTDSFALHSGTKAYAYFESSQLVGVNVFSSQKKMPGLPSIPIPGKLYHLGLYVRPSPQESWTYIYSFDDEGIARNCRAAVQSCLPEGQVLVLLKTRERVSFSEVADVLAKRRRPSSTEDARKMIESQIMSGDVDGIINGEGYVSRSVLQRDVPQREVIRSETITREIVKVPCRYCGTMNNLATDKFCSGCGSPVK